MKRTDGSGKDLSVLFHGAKNIYFKILNIYMRKYLIYVYKKEEKDIEEVFASSAHPFMSRGVCWLSQEL